ncbi:hypothetical protein AKJ57_02020 [candidate division MSBL1 archaeon SCGC-AAA259A05]|uniref:Transcription factor CBF/NF-Y/archaeal histone domain-containing protein n=1 Tax=candidate division MSBL1 archaeon SCGC-AAA259A05 TaxID=1698259 RepID=A0A133UAN6_9EURY|nr:hypothetical protein AKJ57_02020 [candidate division MSBL1 archaeon SCGC-AAA259A05]
MPEFSLASMERILRKAGNERVSKDASLELSAVLESFGKEMGREAVRKAEQEGIKTIKKRHIKAAARELEI